MVRSFLKDRRTDRQLVEVCNNGGRKDATKAFETLYRRHKDYVLRIAFRFSNDHDIALDVLQETFVYVLRKFPPPGPGLELTAQLTTLLYPVAKNLAISATRKTERFKPGAVDPDELAAAPSPAALNVDPLLAELSPQHQEVIQLRCVDDMSLQDIASALEVPLGTVKSRLHQAIKQLKNKDISRKFFGR